MDSTSAPRSLLAGIMLVSAGLLMTELALTRIFSVTMYYHFAFLAISIALFGLSASGIWVFLRHRRLARQPIPILLARHALIYSAVTLVVLAVLVRLRVGLTYSVRNLLLMIATYVLAAFPFFAGGSVISIAVFRLSRAISLVYAADLVGAAAGCLLLIPLLDWLGAPGAILSAAAFAGIAALLFAPAGARRRTAALASSALALPLIASVIGWAPFEVRDTKGHDGDRILFSKWNSFSRVAVYDRGHGDWSLSQSYRGPLPETRFMDIDSAASTPILRADETLSGTDYLRYDLTAFVYYLKARASGFRALVIGPGGGRDLLAALVFGATRVDGVEINPIIARDVMNSRFRDFSGRVYTHPRVRIFIDDGRSFVRRSHERYDVIQASLVDTWAATAAGAYTLTENTLYTVEAFDDYLDRLADDGVISITRWVFDGLRLISLAQEVCARRGWNAADRLFVAQYGQVATVLLKKTPFTAAERDRLLPVARKLGFIVLYAPGSSEDGDSGTFDARSITRSGDYRALILAPDRTTFYERYPIDVTPTTDDRPFFFHTTKLKDQMHVAFGRSMLFGNGLSALLTLMGISVALVTLFLLGPLALSGVTVLRGGALTWLLYFSALGIGFMLIEVALLQRFVLLVGHPVYSLTVTLCSLLLGTGIGSFLTRRIDDANLRARVFMAVAAVVIICLAAAGALPALIRGAIAASRPLRIALTAALLLPTGIVMGVPLPGGIRLVSKPRPDIVPWAWGLNGALSVIGATLAVFIAMNWGFALTLAAAAGVYTAAAALLTKTARHNP